MTSKKKKSIKNSRHHPFLDDSKFLSVVMWEYLWKNIHTTKK